MVKLSYTFLLVFFATFLFAQSDNKQSYYPLEVGQSKTLTWYKSQYNEVVTDTVSINSKTYYTISQQFPNNKIDILQRLSGDTIYFYNKIKKLEYPFFSIELVVGKTVGNGTVKSVNAKLKTPKGKLTELLEIEMNYSNGQRDNRFYKRGVGLVAVKNKKGLICYLIP